MKTIFSHFIEKIFRTPAVKEKTHRKRDTNLERRVMEQTDALARTEKIYRQAIAGAGAVPYSFDYRTRTYSFIGAGIEELTGYAPAEMNPAVWQQITRETIMLGETAGMDHAVAAQKVVCGEIGHWRCDMRVVARDGKSRWIADASVQNLDEAGRAIGSMGILQDITERKQAELVTLAFSKLGRYLSSAASRKEAARIIGDVAQDLFHWDAFWVSVYSKNEDTVFSVYDVDTVDGQRIVSHGEKPRKATEFHHRLIQNGAELLLRDADTFLPEAKPFGDASRPSASLMFAPIRLGERVVGLLSVQCYTRNAYSQADLKTLQTLADHCAGALERIQLDEARRESELQFKLVWDTSVDGMRLADREGNVVMVNDAYCRMVDKDKTEVEGQPLTVAYCRTNAEEILKNYCERINSNNPHSHLETEVTLWNGRKVWLELSNSVLKRPGKDTFLLSILRDVTERKQAESVALAFSKLSRNLNSVASRHDAARIIGNVANDLFGWDAFWIQLYSEQERTVYPLYNVDTIDGRRVENSAKEPELANKLHDRLIRQGAEFVLRETPAFSPETKPFGDASRPSASLMFAPVRLGARVVGFLSVQSYAHNAYSQADIGKLQTLADHCAGALERVRFEEAQRHERELLNALLNNSEDKIYFKDTESRFIRCSASMVKLFGVQKVEDIIGKQDRDFFLEAHACESFEDEQKIIRTAEPLLTKVEREAWPDGRITWALTSKMPLRNQTGEIVGTFGISKDITVIKDAEAKLNQLHKQLLDTSRMAGMAEVATSVLHNVGNVLNSVNVSSSLIADKMRNSKMANIAKVAALIRKHETDLANFLTNDSKGQQLPGYIANLAELLAQEQKDILNEISSLVNNVSHIKEIVTMQQSYAKSFGVFEPLEVVDLVEDALRMNSGAVSRHNIKVTREFDAQPVIVTDKHKVLQILVNLIRNAKHACDDSGRVDKQIILRIVNGSVRVKISVADNGVGIAPENMTRIFNHGFTTRKDGHGFGLHSGALAAKELGGSLTVFSDGIGKGAAFTLELPVQKQNQIYEHQPQS